MADQISTRREHSSAVRTKASDLLATKIATWCDPEELSKRVCVYTTGSFGRGDASEHSDLDLFIVSKVEDVTSERSLSGLEEIELMASIVQVNRELGLPDPDADGGFLTVHSLPDYLVGLGKPSDDANNTFTGRLLLLLESQPILGAELHEEICVECISRYWNDYADHSESFLPAFLMNDILRFWRTLCVNYEAGMANTPEKRRAKNYKLKHSRVLTCYSAIIALQAEFLNARTISQKRALEIIRMNPIERIAFAQGLATEERKHYFDEAVKRYSSFLAHTNCSKEELYSKMRDPEYYKQSLSEARLFGDVIFKIMHSAISAPDTDEADWRFFRYLSV